MKTTQTSTTVNTTAKSVATKAKKSPVASKVVKTQSKVDTTKKSVAKAPSKEVAAQFVSVTKTLAVKPVKKDSKTFEIFKMLCKGATVKEISDKFGWTIGAVSSVVYWEPNYKGYGLERIKKAGRGTVLFLTLGESRITPSKIAVA